MNTTKELRILKVEDGGASEKTDPVAVEQTLHIYVNGQHHTILAATPQYLEELALGHLFSAGIIRNLADVDTLTTDADFRTIWVETVRCEVQPAPVSDGLRVLLTDILFNMEQFLHKSAVFFATGAVHSCALIVDGRMMHFMEDIGRHNALDKTFGAALRGSTHLDRAVVLTSGRIHSDMMIKVIHSRSQVVVSRSAPTDAAVELALRYNVTMCGFARGNQLNIYTGRHRILV